MTRGTTPPPFVAPTELPVDEDMIDAVGRFFRVLVGGSIRNGQGIEYDQVRVVADGYHAPVMQAEAVRRQAGHLSYRLLEGKQALLHGVPANHARKRAPKPGMRMPVHG